MIAWLLNWIIFWIESPEFILNWIIFWIESWVKQYWIEYWMNHFLAKFKYWIESDWVSFATTPLPQHSHPWYPIKLGLIWRQKMVQKQFATHLSFNWNWIAKTDLTNYCRSEMLGSPQNTILVISFAQGRGLTGYPQIPKSFSPKPLSLMGGRATPPDW